MPDDDSSAMTTSKAATAAKTTKAPKTVLTVSGKSFVVGQRVIYTDKNGGQFRATVKKHTESTVTEENADKVKMGILIDGEAALTHVTYPRVRDESSTRRGRGGRIFVIEGYLGGGGEPETWDETGCVEGSIGRDGEPDHDETQ